MTVSFSEKHILVVDDEENIREILQAVLEASGAKVFTAADAFQGLEVVREENLDLVISDINMPGMDGLEFLAKVKEEQPWLPFLLITAHGSMDTVISAMRLGAGDFLTKPFDIKHLREVALGLIARASKPTISAQLPPIGEGKIEGVIGNSAPFRAALDTALKAARTDSSVLVLGESGTGKEVIARVIHAHSPRAKGAFIAVNCGAIPENLMESELFGYEKGAFTGALHEKPGKVELAQGGTLFLDEIGEMPLLLQVKLLRVLQERTVDRVGGSQPRKVDFRLVAATNRDLQTEVAQGRFREDLYYRINVIPVKLPALRERSEDIVALSQFFLKKLNDRYGTQHVLSTELLAQLTQHRWQGNIRELENTLERGVVLSDSHHLHLGLTQAPPPSSISPVAATPSSEGLGLNVARENAEKAKILETLGEHRWNKTNTAKALGISRRSLLYKVKAYGIN
jgi:two-component system NtrC family response regulator